MCLKADIKVLVGFSTIGCDLHLDGPVAGIIGKYGSIAMNQVLFEVQRMMLGLPIHLPIRPDPQEQTAISTRSRRPCETAGHGPTVGHENVG